MTASTATSGSEFVISRVFKAPRQKVWDAWTRPEMFTRWFGPKGTEATVHTLELRPGGMLHSSMKTSNGCLWAKFVYKEIDEPSRLVWAHSFSDEHANVVRAPFFDGRWPLVLLTTVIFTEVADGTKVTLTWSPVDATPEERATFLSAMQSMTDGWSGSFDVLGAFLE